MDWLNVILELTAYFLIWTAIDHKRETPLKILSKDWWVILSLILIASIILKEIS